MNETSERNRAIYEARISGSKFKDISMKYGITSNRAKQIYEREKKKQEIKQYKYYEILSCFTDNEKMIIKTINVLERNELDSKEKLITITRKELLKYWNCGEVMTDLILKVADVLKEQRENYE